MHESCKQIFKSYLIFSHLHFDLTIFLHFVTPKDLGNINWEVLQLVKLGKPHLLWNF